MVTMSVSVRDRVVTALFEQLMARSASLSAPLGEIGELVRSSVIRNFQEGGRPERWPKSARARKEGGQTLVDTARMRNSINVRVYLRHVEVGTNVAYAAAHQFGAEIRPRTIVPRRKKALYWPGAAHPVRVVNHPGARIPARPFLMVQDEDWPEIRWIVLDYLKRG
jgi:phage gpG-like protein